MTETSYHTNTPDIKLVGAALQGDLTAFGILTQRYWPLALAMALSRLHNAADAEDIAQESFIKAYTKLASLRDPQRFAGWLSRIVIQQCVDARRQQQRQKRALGHPVGEERVLNSIPVYSTNPGLSAQQIRFVRQTISALPERFKSTIILRFVGGLSAVEIAQQLGKRPGTIRVWLHRAYELLRQELAPLLEEV